MTIKSATPYLLIFFAIAIILLSISTNAQIIPGWTEQVPLMDPPLQGIVATNFDTLYDSRGNVHLFWEDLIDQEIYYMKTAYGKVLVPATRVTNAPGISRRPTAVADQQGNIHLAWEDVRDGNAQIYYTKLDNDGRRLTQDIRLTPLNTGRAYYPSIGTDINGDVYVVWLDVRDGSYRVYYTKLDNNGNTLIDDLPIALAGFGSTPRISVDGDGTTHIVWAYNQGFTYYVKHAKVARNGVTVRTIVTSSERVLSPVGLARDAMGNLHLAWAADVGSLQSIEIFYVKLDNNGERLTPDIMVTRNPTFASQRPDITVDRWEKVHIAWLDDRVARLSNPEVFYTKLDNSGNTLVDDLRISYMDSSSNAPQIIIDNNGDAVIIWPDIVVTGREHVLPFLRKSYSQLTLRGEPSPGSAVNIDLVNALNPNAPYYAILAFNERPGIPLGDGRTLALSPDALFMLSLTNPQLFGNNLQGALDNNGRATAQLRIPQDIQRPFVMYLAFVIINPIFPYPLSIASTSYPLQVFVPP